MSKNRFFGLLYLGMVGVSVCAVAISSCKTKPEQVYEYRGVQYNTESGMINAICMHADSLATKAETYQKVSDSLLKAKKKDLSQTYRDSSIMYLGATKRVLKHMGTKVCP